MISACQKCSFRKVKDKSQQHPGPWALQAFCRQHTHKNTRVRTESSRQGRQEEGPLHSMEFAHSMALSSCGSCLHQWQLVVMLKKNAGAVVSSPRPIPLGSTAHHSSLITHHTRLYFFSVQLKGVFWCSFIIRHS